MNHLKDQRGVAFILELALVAAVLVLVGIAVYASMHRKPAAPTVAKTTATISPSPSPSPSATPSPDVYAGWKTCNDTTEGISFKYPPNWSATVDSTPNPCASAKVQSGDYFQGTSPQTGSSPYIYMLQYFGNKQAMGCLDNSSGQTVLSVTPLNVKNSKVALSLVAYADNTLNRANVFELALTDQAYSAGQVVTCVPKVKSQSPNGVAYAMTAVLTKPGQQYNGDYTMAQYQSQPDYNTMINIFKSFAYATH